MLASLFFSNNGAAYRKSVPAVSWTVVPGTTCLLQAPVERCQSPRRCNGYDPVEKSIKRVSNLCSKNRNNAGVILSLPHIKFFSRRIKNLLTHKLRQEYCCE